MSGQFLSAQVLPSVKMSAGVAVPTSLDYSSFLDLPPPTYAEATKVPRLSYIDFPPKCSREGGILTPPIFERFHHLVERANMWLKRHPEVTVRSLETVDYETNNVSYGKTVDTTAVSRFGHSQHGVISLKVLRMWIGSRDGDDPDGIKQLGYLNVVPSCIDCGGISHKPRFEPLDVTINKLNAAFVRKPLPGNIMSIERIWMKFRQHCTWVDADRCHFHERHEIPTCCLYGLRVFYETSSPTPTIIGFQDFLPDLTLKSNQNSKKVTGSFTELVKKARMWISQNQDVFITNFQTLHCRAKLPNITDLNKTLTISYRSSDLIQVLRVWFQQFPNQTISDLMPPVSLNMKCRKGWLHCRTFCPSLCDTTWRSIYVTSQYESLADVRQRITDWLLQSSVSDLQVISAETPGVKIDIGETILDGEKTFLSSSYGDSQSWIRVLRVYFESSSELEDWKENSKPEDTEESSSSPVVSSSIISTSQSVSSSRGCTIN